MAAALTIRVTRAPLVVRLGVAGGGSIGPDLTAIEALTGTGWAKRTADNVWTLSTPTAADVGALTLAAADGLYDPLGAADTAQDLAATYTDNAVATKQDADPVLDAFVLLSGSGFVVQASAGGNFVLRSVAVSGAGLSVADGNGVSGNPTLSLSGDVAAIEALAGTGIARRTGSNTWSVGTTVDVSEGGTGATTASDARSNLGLVIGTHVQAYDAGLASLAALPTAADRIAYSTAADTWAETILTAFARTLLDDTTQAAARTTLGALASVNVTIDVQGSASSSGTYTAPSGAVLCLVRGWGGGGGGGGGRRDDTATAGSAGGGGQAGEAGWFADLPSTLTGLSWTVGAAGTGGPGRTTSTGNGTDGGAGGATTFAGRRWKGGDGGPGGSNAGAAGAGTTGAVVTSSGRLATAGLGTPAPPLAINTAGNAGYDGTLYGGGSGGNGGGIATGTTARSGGAGGQAAVGSGGGTAGTGAAAAPGGAGGNGTSPTTYEPGGGGGGGGNAGAAGTGAAGAGGNGGNGAGGGGGGAAHGCDGGAGGNGGTGALWIFTICVATA